MKLISRKVLLAVLVVMVLVCLCESKKRRVPSRLRQKTNRITKLPKLKNQKQMLYETRETSPPNFVTLLFFRLVYGIATQMGLEDRLPGFVAPPNAEDADYGFFSLGGEAPSIFGGGDDYDFGF
jgi:hypothetical protein